MEIFLGNVILFIFASIGMSHIIVDGKILQKVKDSLQKVLPESLFEIFKCYQCSGFWSGAFIGYFSIVKSVSDFEPLSLFATIALTFVCGCAGSFLSPWAAIYLNVLETRMVVDYKGDDSGN